MAHPTAHKWGDSVINSGEIPVIVGTAAEGGRLIVTNPSLVVVRILHLAGLFTLLDIESSAE